MEIIKGDGGAPTAQQIQLDFKTESRIVAGTSPGAMRLVVAMTVKMATQGEGARRIGAIAEIEVFEGADVVMEAMVGQIATEWKSIVQKARDLKKKMQEAPQIVRPGAPVLSKEALERIKRGE